MKRIRVHLAQLISRAERIFVPLCKGPCRQPVTKPCTCSWLPPLPDELRREE